MTVAEQQRRLAQDARRGVGEHPLPSALTVFGAGFGIGLLAVSLLGNSARDDEAALSEKVLQVLSRAVPESLSRNGLSRNG